MRTLLLAGVLSLVATGAFAQAAVQGDQARRKLLEHKAQEFAVTTQPIVSQNIGAMFEVDRQINRVYQVLNNKYGAQGKSFTDRRSPLTNFSSHGTTVPSANIADAEAQAAEEAFLAQQEEALMAYVNEMQQARWSQEKKKKASTATVVNPVPVAKPQINGGPRR
jgi:hypothetical protein